MFLSQSLEQLQAFTPDDFNQLPDLLEPELIEQCLQDTGVTTVRKRRLPMDFMMWAVDGTVWRTPNTLAPRSKKATTTLYDTLAF